jgi:hypothetical protein
MQQTTSGAAGNGLFTTAKYMRGAAGISLGTTPIFCAAGVSRLLKSASTTPRSHGRRHRSWHHACNAQRAAPRTSLYFTIKYIRGATGIGLGTTIKYRRRTTSTAANNGLGTTIKYLVNQTRARVRTGPRPICTKAGHFFC